MNITITEVPTLNLDVVGSVGEVTLEIPGTPFVVFTSENAQGPSGPTGDVTPAAQEVYNNIVAIKAEINSTAQQVETTSTKVAEDAGIATTRAAEAETSASTATTKAGEAAASAALFPTLFTQMATSLIQTQAIVVAHHAFN